MANPYGHNQLATLSGMDIEYNREEDRFYYEQTFDFENSVDLQADVVAETWRDMFEDEDQYEEDSTGVTVDGSKLTIWMEYEGVNTRHGLKRAIAMLASNMVAVISTHDPEQGVEVAEHILETAEEV